MDYTLSDGTYYKVIDSEKQVVVVGELKEGEVLSTILDVEFITEGEYLEAQASL